MYPAYLAGSVQTLHRTELCQKMIRKSVLHSNQYVVSNDIGISAKKCIAILQLIKQSLYLFTKLSEGMVCQKLYTQLVLQSVTEE